MSTVSRRFSLIIDDDIGLDLEDMLAENRNEAAVVIALLDELRGNAEACGKLVDEDYDDDAIKSVEPFWALQDQRYNAYRVRFYEVDHWRMITAVDYRQNLIAVLYIMRRDEDYNNEVQRRVIAAYEKLGLRRVGH